MFGGSGGQSGGSSNGPNPTTTAPATSNLLSNPTTSAPIGVSLFPNPATFENAGSSVFSKPSNTAPAIGSIFPKPLAATSEAGSVFNQPNTMAPPGASIFQPASTFSGSTLTGGSQNGPPKPQPSQSTSGPGYFQSLVEKNKKRARNASLSSSSRLEEASALQLGLGDISKRVRQLGGGEGERKKDSAEETRAHYLLAASGVNPGRTIHDLNSFDPNAASVSAPGPPDWDPDSHKYVEQLQQQTTMKMIANGIARSQREFDSYLQEHVDIDWEAQRRKIYEHFGLNPKGSGRDFGQRTDRGGFGRSSRRGRDTNGVGRTPMNRSIFNQSSLHKSVIGTPAVGGGNMSVFGDSVDKESRPALQDDRFLREKQQKFADKVRQLNESRLEGGNFTLLKEFSSVESTLRGESASYLIESYKALIETVGEANEGGVPARKFVEDYLDDSPNSPRSFNMRRTLLEGARKALEKQFYEKLSSIVDRNQQDARMGGAPTRTQRIRAYIRVREARKDLAPEGIELRRLDNGDFCWALIYFLLRCGFVREAADYVADRQSAFSTVDRPFQTYMTSYANNANRKLSAAQQTKIQSDYMQKLRAVPENSQDPYRMACHKIIGRCDLAKRTLDGISQGTEDWIWLQVCLAREVNRAEDLASEVFGLEQVQETIRDIGVRYFSKGSENTGEFGTYFFLLILGGLFETAVDFLYTHSYIAAVHFAIALDYYGLLRVSDFSTSEPELLTRTTREEPQINFSRMIGYYTRDFRASNVVAATDYLVLICLNADLPTELGRSQEAVCHEALRELVLETREFAQLLGDIYSDGRRVPGAIERRLRLIRLSDEQEYLRQVTQQAASVADTNGRTTDSVLLYHLAEDYGSVIAAINRAMSDALSAEPGTEPEALQPLKPRDTQQDGQQPGQENATGSSLSMAGVDDPFTLARHFTTLYFNNALYSHKVSPKERDIAGFLLELLAAREHLQGGRFDEFVNIIDRTHMLPISANGEIATIRKCAQSISSAPPAVGRLIGPMLLWTLTAISNYRDALSSSIDDNTRKGMREQLARGAKDLMVYAGLVKLRMQKSYWEAIVNAAAENGVY